MTDLNRLALAASLAASLLAPAYAADPESGTINDGTHRLAWSGGPYTMANITPQTAGLAGLAGVPMEPTCEEGTPTCDVFRFEVAVSDIEPEDDIITISVEWPTPDFDYDIYLYNDETGDRITDAATSGDPEVIIIPAQNGKYRLVVIPFTVVEEGYTGTVVFEDFDDDKSAFGFAGALTPALLLPLLALAALVRRRRAH